MLFSSTTYYLAFLPLVVIAFYLLAYRTSHGLAKAALVVASLFFYAYWEPKYLPILLVSVLFNYFLGRRLTITKSKPLLIFGIIANLSLLGVYKYADFILWNVSAVTGVDTPMLDLLLPLAISFFTFQQIAFLVDTYQGKIGPQNPLDYSLFVTFFPQLIAGPIVHHSEMMPQFADKTRAIFNGINFSTGIFIFTIGLAKKIIFADTFGTFADAGFDDATALGFYEAWATSLSYTFQLYFDFSGYADMAIGSALMFNIRLPINFNSPYKAISIQDFWRRWHMTLSRWLRDYIYIPLGGSRNSDTSTLANLFITFLLGGIWHGAAWTFIAWGVLHGLAIIIHRLWHGAGYRMPKLAAWLTTFLFINATWVFFRALSFGDAVKVLKGMAGLNGVSPTANFVMLANARAGLERFPVTSGFDNYGVSILFLGFLVIGMFVAFIPPNSMEITEKEWKRVSRWSLVCLPILFFCITLFSVSVSQSPFLYFNF